MEKYLNSMIMENTTVVEQPIRLETFTTKLTSKAVDFIRKSNEDQKPFALYMSYPNVHDPYIVGNESRGKSRHGPYGDRYSMLQYLFETNNDKFNSLYEMDLSIGRIMDTLENLGMDKNTLIYFTSDHGAYIELQTGSNRPFAGTVLFLIFYKWYLTISKQRSLDNFAWGFFIEFCC